MSAQMNFRTSLNGFNREDVVHYIESLNTKHSTALNQLKEENLALTDELNAMMAAHYASDVEVKPGVPAYLEKLKQQGVKMCIASATSVPLVTICLERLGLKDYFEFFLSCVDVNASKDKPDVFIAAEKFLGTPRGQTWVFEDSLLAAQTAKAARSEEHTSELQSR